MSRSPSEQLADRVRAEIGGMPGMTEIRMMGGLCFMLDGNMAVCTMKNGDLLARVGPETHDAAMKRPGAGPMPFTNRPSKGFVNVDAAVLDEATLKDWIALSLAFVRTMPPKERARPSKPVSRKARPA